MMEEHGRQRRRRLLMSEVGISQRVAHSSAVIEDLRFWVSSALG